MKNIIYLLLFFPLIVLGQSQNQNYVKTKKYLKPSIGAITANDTLVSITYADGLGRPIQSVAARAGGQGQDIITPIVYDDFGRQSRSYLPLPESTLVSSPDYRDNNVVLQDLNAYYLEKFPGQLSATAPNPYSETFYEASPLNRVVKQAAPGEAWKRNDSIDDHTIKFSYGTNTKYSVYKFYVYFPDSTDTEKPKLGIAGHYNKNQLYKTVTKDENWVPADGNNRTTHEYTDKEGRVILKRAYNNNEPHDTYYVYDDYSNLTYVIPPLAAEQIVIEAYTYLNQGVNYPWTVLSLVDAALADSYSRALEDYDNAEILNADLFDKYGGQGGFSVAPGNNGGLVLNLNITTAKPMPLRTGFIADLREFGTLQSKEQGRISGTDYEYIFLIEDNKLFVTGEGDVPSIAATLTGETKLEYSKNYPWTKLCIADPAVAAKYEKDILLLDDSEILTTYTDNIYGARGGIAVNVDEDDTVTVSLTITADTALELAQGAVLPLDIERGITDRPLGTVQGAGYSYEFSIKNNSLHIVGSGFFNNLTFYSNQVMQAQFDLREQAEALCYIYHYDHRNRVIEKHIPDNGWSYMVYDKLDRVILTQDENQRLKNTNNWLFTKYDQFGRLAYSGEYTDLRSRDSIQNVLNSVVNPVLFETRSAVTFTSATQQISYTNNAFPTTNLSAGMVNYYEDYNFDKAGLTVPSANYYGEALTTRRKGLLTCTKVKIIGGSWITTLIGYDAKGRQIWSGSRNAYHLTFDYQDLQLDFTDKITKSRVRHTKTNQPEIILEDFYTYDHAGRLLTHRQKENNTGHIELISSNWYNELGQAVGKKVGGNSTAVLPFEQTTALQNVGYGFNIRGWLTGINATRTKTMFSLFALEINYNDTTLSQSTPLYNGNISEVHWKSKTDNRLRSYSYRYDAMNRLTDANYNTPVAYPLQDYPTQVENYKEGAISYDKNGNIDHLERWGLTAANTIDKIDVLEYSYYPYSNRLKSVTDTADSNKGFKNGTTGTGDDYEYDDNGNLKHDLNKGIGETLANKTQYNYLNLPEYISFGNGNEIRYKYDGTGKKVQKVVTKNINGVVTTTTTLYLNGFVYVNNVLQYYAHPEGYVSVGPATMVNGVAKYMDFSYIYQYKDHLGNVRLSYTDADGNGSIANSEVIEENNYYAFGMEHEGYNNLVQPFGNDYAQKYKYNGIEYEEALGLDIYEMGVRQYDPTIARWVVVDPVIHYSLSPYNAFDNNPVYWADPSGANSVSTTLMDLFNSAGSGTTIYNSNGDGTFSFGGFIPVPAEEEIHHVDVGPQEYNSLEGAGGGGDTYAKNLKFSYSRGTVEIEVSVHYKYTLNEDEEISIIENSIKVHTSVSDWLSGIDKYYDNQEFQLKVEPSIVIRGNYIVFEQKGTFILGNLKIFGYGYEVNPVIHTFTGIINYTNPSDSHVHYNSRGKGVGKLFQ